MLGKQVLALPLFILIFAWKFRRLKEGIISVLVAAVPTLLWYAYVRLGLGLPYYMVNVSVYDQGAWFLRAYNWETYKMLGILISSVPKFISATLYGFLIIPVALSIYGLFVLNKANKYFIYFSFIVSFFLLFLGMNYFRDTLSFLMFPAIFLTAAVGLEEGSARLKKYGSTLPHIFYFGMLALIIFLSGLNFYLLTLK
jgi:hypothetical protein